MRKSADRVDTANSTNSMNGLPGTTAASSVQEAQMRTMLAMPTQTHPHGRGRQCFDLTILAALGAASIALWRFIQPWGVLADHAAAFIPVFSALLLIYFLAVGWLFGRKMHGRSVFIVLFVIAIAARFVMIQQIPTASDDIYRYVWDGRVQAAGINPYRYPPNDPALASLHDPKIFPDINRPNVRTIYPPVAEVVFRLVFALHPNSVTWTKYAFSLVDLAVAVLLASILRRMGLNPALVIVYLWHPLLVLEVAHSGHVDIVAVLLLLLAIEARRTGRQTVAGVLCAAAVLVKFYVFAALPALMSGGLRRREFRLPLAFAASVALAYLPFLSVGTHVFGFLGGYAAEEGFASGVRYFLLTQALQKLHPLDRGISAWYTHSPLHVLTPTAVYTGLMLVVLAVVSLWCLLRPPSQADTAAIANRVAVLLLLLFTFTTSSQPWYLLVLLVCVPLVARPLAVACSIAVACAPYGYLHWWFDKRPIWPWWVEYDGRAIALLIVVIWGISRLRQHAGN